uniref:Uncharacterized protein n=1 Tax=Stomoxys calcitrans TaxID=35570 RepID=A0A1I8Q1A1_STOCA
MNNGTRFGASEAKENEENLSKIQTVEEMRHEDSVFYEEKIEDTVKSVGEDVAVLELYTKVTSNDVLNELSFQSDIQVNYENENNSSENKSVPVKTDIDILSIAESPKIEVSNNTKYISINSVGEERIPRYFHGIPQTSLENNIAPKRKLYKDAMAFTIPFDNQKIITSKRSKPQSPSQKPDIEIDMDFIEVDSELEAESPTKLFEELIEIENNNIDAIDLDITQAIDDIIRIKCGRNEDKVSSDEDSHFSSTPETSLHTIVELSEPDVAKTKEFVIIAQRTPDLNQLLTDKKCDGMRSNVNDHDKCVKNILPDVYEELIELAPIPPSNGSSLDKDDFEYHLIKEINKLEKTIKSDEEGLSISLEQKKGYSATIIQRAVRQFLNSRKTREHIYINHNHEYTESELAPISPDSSPSLDNDIEYHLTNEINNIKRTSKIDEEGLTIYLEQKERYSATIIQRAVREFLKSKKTRERNMNQNHEGIKDDSNIEVEFSTDKRNKATLIIQRAFRKYLLDTKKHTYSGVPTDSVIGAKYVTLNSKEKYDGIVDKSRAAIVIQNAFRNYLQRKPKCLVPKSSDHLLQHEFNPPVIGPKNVTLNSKENHDGRVDKSRAAIVIQNAFRNYLQRKPKCLVRKSNDHQLQHESNPPAQSHYLLNETQELLYSEDKVADYKGFTDPDQNEVNDCNDNRLSPINPEKGIHIPIFKTIDSHKENRRLTSLEASEEYAAIVIQNFFKAYFDKTPSKLKTLDKIDNPLNQGGNSNGKFVNAARTIQNAYRKYYNQKHDILERKPIDKSHNPNSSFDGGNNGHLFQKNSSTSLKDTKLRFNNAIIVIQKAFRKYRQQKFVALEGENYRKKSLEATRNSAAIILQKAFRRYKQQHCNSEFASKELDEKFIDYSKKNDTIEARELNSTHLHKHGMPTEEFDEHIKKSNWYVGDEPIVTSGLTEVKQAETPFEETVAYLEFGDNPPNLFGSENSTSLVTVDAIVSDITTNAPVFTSNNNDTKKDEYVINELLPEPGNELLFEMPPDKPLNVEDKTIPNIVERKSEHNKKMIASFLESERAFSGRSSEYLWAKSPNTEEIAEIHRDFVQAERSCANRPGKIANGDPNSSETETDDSLKLKYEKLDGLDNSIAKMQQRKESTHKISSKFEYRKYTFEDSSVDSVIYFENNVDTDEEGIIVGKMESNDSRESSAQSDIILCEDGGENLNFENQNDSYNELSIRGLLKRVHTIATDSDIKNLMKSVTIDDSVRYIEPADDQLTSENFFLDDDTSENIRRKMMAYSLSEADSDCFDKSEVNNAIDDKTRTLDSFNIRTALIDNGDTSTETESTIVSAVTKIQAGARGYLARKRLGRTSDCKSTVILNESGASFGNAAISESLEYLLQETAAKRIQMFYRNYREKHGKFNTVHPPKRVSLSTTSAESSLAQKRSMLQRGDALRNNSTPDEGNSSSNDSENCVSVNARDVNQHSISKANISDAAKRAKHIENNKMKWIAMRQNSMPVQIDSEVFRVIPKHMRKKTKSAEIGKGHRKRPFCYD